nr:immunoglobulin heavy chain junction region [Mus musculus]
CARPNYDADTPWFAYW